MPKFRKKPVEVEAEQWKGTTLSFPFAPVKVYDYQRSKASPYSLVTCNYCNFAIHEKMGNVHLHTHGWIETLEGGHIVCPGDWIIKGVKGEFYPCKPDIFAATYEDAAIALMRGQSWQVVGYMDPDADFMLPRDGGCVLSTQLILVRTPTERYSRPVYLPTPPKDTADEQ